MSEILATTNKQSAKVRQVRIRGNGYLWSGGFIVAVLILASIFATYIAPALPNKMDVAHSLAGIGSPGHILGTDNYGRDMLSRLIYGGRTTLLSGVVASLLAVTAGTIWGVISGYLGSIVDAVLMRTLDVLMSFPFILLAILIVAFAGPSSFHALLAVSFANLPFFARVVRSEVINIKNSEYIMAAKLAGGQHIWILYRHIIPNVMPYIIVNLFINIGWMISQTSALSFLGFGTQPPTADWGSMLSQAQTYMGEQGAVAILPGVMISLSVVGFNLIGVGLNNWLRKNG